MPLVGPLYKEPKLYVPQTGVFAPGRWAVVGQWGEKKWVYTDRNGKDLLYIPGTHTKQFGPNSWAEMFAGNWFGGANFGSGESSGSGDLFASIFSLGATSLAKTLTTAIFSGELLKTLSDVYRGNFTPRELYDTARLATSVALAFVPGVGGIADVAINTIWNVTESSLETAGIGSSFFGTEGLSTGEIWSNFAQTTIPLIIPGVVSSVEFRSFRQLADLTVSTAKANVDAFYQKGVDMFNRSYEFYKTPKGVASFNESKSWGFGPHSFFEKTPQRIKIEASMNKWNFQGKIKDLKSLQSWYRRQNQAHFKGLKPGESASILPIKNATQSSYISKSLGDFNKISGGLEGIRKGLKDFIGSGMSKMFESEVAAIEYLKTGIGRSTFKLGNASEALITKLYREISFKAKISNMTITKYLTKVKGGVGKFNKTLHKPLHIINEASKYVETMGTEVFGKISEKNMESLKEAMVAERELAELENKVSKKSPALRTLEREANQLKKFLVEEGGALVNSKVILGYKVLSQHPGTDIYNVQIVFNPATTGATSTKSKNHGGKKPVFVQATSSQLSSLEAGGMRVYLREWAMSDGGRVPAEFEIADRIIGNIGAWLPIAALTKILMITSRIRRATVEYKSLSKEVSEGKKGWLEAFVDKTGEEIKKKSGIGLKGILRSSVGGGMLGKAVASASSGKVMRLRKTKAGRSQNYVSRQKTKVKRVTTVFSASGWSPKPKAKL